MDSRVYFKGLMDCLCYGLPCYSCATAWFPSSEQMGVPLSVAVLVLAALAVIGMGLGAGVYFQELGRATRFEQSVCVVLSAETADQPWSFPDCESGRHITHYTYPQVASWRVRYNVASAAMVSTVYDWWSACIDVFPSQRLAMYPINASVTCFFDQAEPAVVQWTAPDPTAWRTIFIASAAVLAALLCCLRACMVLRPWETPAERERRIAETAPYRLFGT